jgi:hypothetical protein
LSKCWDSCLEHIRDPKSPLTCCGPSAGVAWTVRLWMRGPSGTLAWTVRPLTDYPISLDVIIFLSLSWYWDYLYCVFQWIWWSQEEAGRRFLSKHRRADDLDYNSATNSEAQSSAGGSVSLDTEDAPHSHPDYPIEITG